MDYIGSHENINWLFILVLLSTLQWVLTLKHIYQNYSLIGNEISKKSFTWLKDKKKEKRIAFSKDFFYIYWNLFPIIFYFYFYYLDTSWDTYLNQLIMIGGQSVKFLYQQFFIKITLYGTEINWACIDFLIIEFSAGMALLAIKSQKKKQKEFIRERNKIYWWDIRLFPKIYHLRLFFLFLNIILITFLTYITLKITIFLIIILTKIPIHINPFYPDNYGGLSIFMEIASILFTTYLLFALLAVVGFLDHIDIKEKKQRFGDIYNSIIFSIGLLFILSFFIIINNKLSSMDMSKFFDPTIFNTFDIQEGLSSKEIIQKANSLSAYYSSIIKFNKFPIDFSLFVNAVFTFILPLIFWIYSIFKERKLNNI